MALRPHLHDFDDAPDSTSAPVSDTAQAISAPFDNTAVALTISSPAPPGTASYQIPADGSEDVVPAVGAGPIDTAAMPENPSPALTNSFAGPNEFVKAGEGFSGMA